MVVLPSPFDLRSSKPGIAIITVEVAAQTIRKSKVSETLLWTDSQRRRESPRFGARLACAKARSQKIHGYGDDKAFLAGRGENFQGNETTTESKSSEIIEVSAKLRLYQAL